MRTIGKIIKEERINRRYTLDDVEAETKIKSEFIKAIEKEDWGKLPEYPVVQGFIKNLAQALGIDRGQAMALLRRDYPPKSLKINPNPDLKEKFTWGPKLTFLISIVLVLAVILGYLGVQYISFIKPPLLEVVTPGEGEVVTMTPLRVVGKTDPEATIKINNQLANVDEDGGFFAEIAIFERTEEITVQATSRSGKETVVTRKIDPELDEAL